MISKIPNLILNTGRKLPIIGFGTWKSKPGEVQSAVETAISCGYRLFDCAHVYINEEEVGSGVQSKIQDGTVKRECLFIASKLWNIYHAPNEVKPACLKSLKNLKTNYLDLYLIHWPQGYVNNNHELYPKDANEKFIYSDVDYLDTWKALIDLQKEGLVKDIGVSNFNEYQINRLIKETNVVPAVNQIEVHPYLVQREMVKYCKDNNITVIGYSSLGSADRPWAKESEPVLLENPKILEIAKRLNKTPAQVVLRFQIERGIVVIPKSVTPSRIESNFKVFDFNLSNEDMDTLFSFNENFRGCKLEWVSDHKYYPFKKNYSE